jgi:hypothetical protein
VVREVFRPAISFSDHDIEVIVQFPS